MSKSRIARICGNCVYDPSGTCQYPDDIVGGQRVSKTDGCGHFKADPSIKPPKPEPKMEHFSKKDKKRRELSGR